MLIDTHAHLDYPDFADLDEVIARASAAGVERVITIGTSIESSKRAVALAEKYPSVYAVVGVHPTSALETEGDIVAPLRELATNRRVVAIGETGLDYHHLLSRRNETDPNYVSTENSGDAMAELKDAALKAAQAFLFEEHLELAAELRLNVVIHQRDAWDRTLEILRPYTGKVRCVFHCFANSFEQAQQVIDLGHLVSFTGIVTFKNASDVQEVAAQMPIDSFMIETDCPYLAPVPFRGKRCEPAHVRYTAGAIARLRGQSVDEIAAETTRTAERFFRP
jgi:TatD DNase family protein